jgi:hypothetical protein
MRRVIRGNKVAVILGDSWYSSHKTLEWVFLPELVELIESAEYQQMTEDVDYFHNERKTQMIIDCLLKLGYKFTEEDLAFNDNWKEHDADIHKDLDFDNPVFTSDKYIEGKSIDGYKLEVKWIDCDRKFAIQSGDFGEYIIYQDEINWISKGE